VSSQIEKIDVMTEGYRLILFKIHTVILLWIFLLAPCAIAAAASDSSPVSNQKKIIVLDPGHGGYDKGAKGPDGAFEKTATMVFARVLAEALNNTYEVVLTRTDDYWVDLLTRTATANHLDADMFISIHTGGSFLHQASGIALYYYEKASTSAFGPAADAMETLKHTPLETPWSDIQNKHQEASKTLAELILNRIDETPQFKADLQGAPLMVLEGADMPAVLIEIGYITNPVDEKNLNDISWMTDAASRIKSGIDDFFQKSR
jgi:N-acetylmuramoyl-L-alanine amidase